MKANEFVKENPWLLDDDMKELKEIITDARDYKFFCLNNFLGHSYDNHGGGVALSIADLKRLVESYELLEECGGLTKAKERVSREEGLPNPNIFYVLVVSSAIADVESCQ